MTHHGGPSVTGGSAPPVTQVIGVSKRFGATTALNDVRLAVAPGEVHALVGRNGAGKSTLVSILTGLQQPDSGTVSFNGQPAPNAGDRAAWRSKVACVYQKLTIIGQLTAAENLFVNRQAEPGRPISWRKLRREASDLLGQWGIEVDPRLPARELNVEQQQMLEIARALSFGARFIILDEPTARLDANGIARLFERIRTLQQQGVTFLFISHHLQEIFDLCQNVTIFRDARYVLSGSVADFSHTALVEAMTGERSAEMSDPRPPLPTVAEPILTVNNLTRAGRYEGVSFQVRPGEILGLAGAASSGKFAVANRH